MSERYDKRLEVRTDAETRERIKVLRERVGLTNKSELVREAIFFMHKHADKYEFERGPL